MPFPFILQSENLLFSVSITGVKKQSCFLLDLLDERIGSRLLRQKIIVIISFRMHQEQAAIFPVNISKNMIKVIIKIFYLKSK